LLQLRIVRLVSTRRLELSSVIVRTGAAFIREA
jgi:hypothetical protein